MVFAYIITIPYKALPALIYHFGYAYAGRSRPWELVVVWGILVVYMAQMAFGLAAKIKGVYTYS